MRKLDHHRKSDALPKREKDDALDDQELGARLEKIDLLMDDEEEPHEAVERHQLREVLQKDDVHVPKIMID